MKSFAPSAGKSRISLTRAVTAATSILVILYSLSATAIDFKPNPIGVESSEIETPTPYVAKSKTEAARPLWVKLGLMGATVVGYHYISLHEDAPIIFATLYSGAALLSLHSYYKDEEELSGLVTPFALIAMALLNATVLRDNDYSDSEMFNYNIAGTALIWAYEF